MTIMMMMVIIIIIIIIIILSTYEKVENDCICSNNSRSLQKINLLFMQFVLNIK